MRHPVTVQVPYPPDADSGDRVQVFTDFGTGTVDTTKPLLPVPVALFPGHARRARGIEDIVLGQHGLGTLRPTAPRKGTLHSMRLGTTPLPPSAPVISVVVHVPPGFGTWTFQARVVDREGNQQQSGEPVIVTMLAPTEPPTIRRFALVGYDDPSDTITFSVSKNTEA